MQLTVATLVHRVPSPLRALGEATVDAAAGHAARLGLPPGASRHEAAWSIVAGVDGDRHAMVPVPIAVATATGDRGELALLLGIDMDGALALAWREGRRTTVTRAAPGGLTDPVRDELADLVADAPDLRCTGPAPDALETVRLILAGLVPEVERRPLATGALTPERSLPHPWLDDVVASVGRAHGADPDAILRVATPRGKEPAWTWLGSGSRAEGRTPGISGVSGEIAGLPAGMPAFHLQNRPDFDVLRLGNGPATYRRRGRERFLAIARGTLPETAWATVGPGTRADRVWALPGLDAYEVDRVEEGSTTLVHLRPRAQGIPPTNEE